MSEKEYVLEGILTKFDTMNRNSGRVYPYPEIVKAMNRMNKIKKIFDEN